LKSFKRGFRNSNPLVLACAALALLPALLGLQAYFTSGAWSQVPLRFWLRADSLNAAGTEVPWQVGRLKIDPPRRPAAYLLGGSTAREATVRGGASLAADVKRAGGPSIEAWNLSASLQTFAQDIAIVDNLPATVPTTVIIGVSPGRFTSDLASARQQLVGDGMLLESQTLHDYMARKYGARKYPDYILPGIAKLLAGDMKSQLPALSRGSLSSGTYKQHTVDSRKQKSEGGKHATLRGWWRVRHPQFVANEKFNVAMLDALVKRCRQRGFNVVLVELPRNLEVIGSLWDGVDAVYQPQVRTIAAKYDVPYLDFNRSVGLPSADFYDYAHLLAPGRVVWENALARRLAALYRSGALAGGR
jgi:hypothetical protein